MKKKKVGLTRPTADNLLQDLTKRAIETCILSKEESPYYVTKLAVFGSYLKGKNKMGDLDIFVEKRCKWNDREQMLNYFEKLPSNNGRGFLQRMAYHENVFYRILLRNNHSISLHDMRDNESMKKNDPNFNYHVFCQKTDLLYNIEERLNNLQKIIDIGISNAFTESTNILDERIEKLKMAQQLLQNTPDETLNDQQIADNIMSTLKIL
jgi:predicted nucleotidyltransferase